MTYVGGPAHTHSESLVEVEVVACENQLVRREFTCVRKDCCLYACESFLFLFFKGHCLRPVNNPFQFSFSLSPSECLSPLSLSLVPTSLLFTNFFLYTHLSGVMSSVGRGSFSQLVNACSSGHSFVHLHRITLRRTFIYCGLCFLLIEQYLFVLMVIFGM